jgi:hypothetical protein
VKEKKISSRSRCREYPQCQINRISLVYPRRIERNRSWFCAKICISLDGEIDGRRFDVDVSNPFLKTFSWIRNAPLIIFIKDSEKLPSSPSSLVKSQ